MLNTKELRSKFIKKTGGVPTVTIEGHKVLSNNIVKVVASFNRQPSVAEARAALSKAFGGKARAIAGTFRPVRMEGNRVGMTGFMTLNTETKVLTSEVASHMREMASNILMDDVDSSVWNVSESATGQKFITRKLNEDLSELVSLASTEKYDVPSMSVVASAASTESRKYVAFVNPVTASIDYGYLFGDVIVSSDSDSVITEVEDDYVVDAQDLEDTDQFDEMDNADEDDVNEQVDAALASYAAHEQYYLAIESQIDRRAVA